MERYKMKRCVHYLIALLPTTYAFSLKDGTVRNATEVQALDAAIRASYLRPPGKLTSFGLPTTDTYTAWPLVYRTWKCEPENTCLRGVVNIACGDAEPTWMYSSVAHLFLESGYSPVHAMSSRGYGENGPTLPDDRPDPLLRHAPFSTHSTDIVADFAEFIRLTHQDTDRDFFLLCHSLGCAVSTAWLQAGLAAEHPFRAVVMNSPAFWPKVPSTYANLPAARQLDLLRSFAESQPTEPAAALGESLSSKLKAPILSEQMWEKDDMYWKYHSSYDSFRRHSNVCNQAGFELAGCTAGISYAYAYAISKMFTDIQYNCIVSDASMALVLQLVVAGYGRVEGGDTVVDNEETYKLCEFHRTSCSSKCTHVSRTRNGMHATLMDVDTVRNTVFNEIIDVFDAHRTGTSPTSTPTPTLTPTLTTRDSVGDYIRSTVWTVAGAEFAAQNDISVVAGGSLTLPQLKEVQSAAATLGVEFSLTEAVDFGHASLYFEYLGGGTVNAPPVPVIVPSAAPTVATRDSVDDYIRSTVWTVAGAEFAAQNGISVVAGGSLTLPQIKEVQSTAETLGLVFSLMEAIDFGYKNALFQSKANPVIIPGKTRNIAFESSVSFIVLITILSVAMLIFTVLAVATYRKYLKPGVAKTRSLVV